MAKKDKVNKAFDLITGSDQAAAQKKDKQGEPEKINPVGVLLGKEELARLDQIAGELDQSRHALLQYAVKDFIKRYDQGERPRTKTETITTLDI
jgi:hypothetical protein